MPPRNLLDMIPPPPNHPPPPPGIKTAAYMSQESIISPKYLFQHPAYQYGDARPYQSGGNNRYKIRPTNQGHYEEPTQCIREPVYALPPSFHQRQSSLRMSNEQKSQQQMSPVDLADELESFNNVVTQFAASRSSTRSGSARTSTRTSSGSQKSSSCDEQQSNMAQQP